MAPVLGGHKLYSGQSMTLTMHSGKITVLRRREKLRARAAVFASTENRWRLAVCTPTALYASLVCIQRTIHPITIFSSLLALPRRHLCELEAIFLMFLVNRASIRCLRTYRETRGKDLVCVAIVRLVLLRRGQRSSVTFYTWSNRIDRCAPWISSSGRNSITHLRPHRTNQHHGLGPSLYYYSAPKTYLVCSTA